MLRTLMGMAAALTMTAAVQAQEYDQWEYTVETDPMTDQTQAIFAAVDASGISRDLFGFVCDGNRGEALLLVAGDIARSPSVRLDIRVDDGEVMSIRGRLHRYRTLFVTDQEYLNRVLAAVEGAQTRVVYQLSGQTPQVIPPHGSTAGAQRFRAECPYLTPPS